MVQESKKYIMQSCIYPVLHVPKSHPSSKKPLLSTYVDISKNKYFTFFIHKISILFTLSYTMFHLTLHIVSFHISTKRERFLILFYSCK